MDKNHSPMIFNSKSSKNFVFAAKFCKAMEACKYWTWLIDSVGKKCCLKTSDSGLTALKWPGASGAKDNCDGTQ